MSCSSTHHVFHKRKQTLGGLLSKFQPLAINCCQSPTSPPTTHANDYMTEMPAPSTQSRSNVDSFCQTLNKPKAPHWIHKRGGKKTPSLPSFLGRDCSAWKGTPDTSHHALTLHHRSPTAVIRITERLHFSAKRGKN